MKQRIKIVDAARGAAAVYVMASHVFWMPEVAAEYGGLLKSFFRYGHQMVILFFLLSGFSIHMSCRERALDTTSAVSDYLWRRFLRIYPLFSIAILLALAMTWLMGFRGKENVSFYSILATLFFVADLEQPGTWFPVLPSNLPLWSLSYEMAYYLVYPAFLRASRYLGMPGAMLVSVVISAMMWLVGSIGMPNHLANVFSVYWIWCFGAVLAELWARQRRFEVRSEWLFPGLALLFGMAFLLEKQPWRVMNDWIWGALWGSLMFIFLVRLSPKSVQPHSKVIAITLTGLVLGVVAAATEVIPVLGSISLFYLRLVFVFCFIGAAIVFELRFSVPQVLRAILRPFNALGACSYAVYVIHYPILLLAFYQLQSWQMHPYWAIVFLPGIVMLGFVLEVHFHPKMAYLCNRIRSGELMPRRGELWRGEAERGFLGRNRRRARRL